MRLLLLAALLGLARRDGAERPLAVALHAQAAPSAIVVGSVLTTAGLGAALRERADVRRVEIFYPFEYGGLSAEPWDLVIVEGWFEAVNAFIHEVGARRAPSDSTANSTAKKFARDPNATNTPSCAPATCADFSRSSTHEARRVAPARAVLVRPGPDFPGLATIGALGVDGFLTNSPQTLAALRDGVGARRRARQPMPVALVLLAADPEAMALPPRADGDERDEGRGARTPPSTPPRTPRRRRGGAAEGAAARAGARRRRAAAQARVRRLGSASSGGAARDAARGRGDRRRAQLWGTGWGAPSAPADIVRHWRACCRARLALRRVSDARRDALPLALARPLPPVRVLRERGRRARSLLLSRRPLSLPLPALRRPRYARALGVLGATMDLQRRRHDQQSRVRSARVRRAARAGGLPVAARRPARRRRGRRRRGRRARGLEPLPRARASDVARRPPRSARGARRAPRRRARRPAS